MGENKNLFSHVKNFEFTGFHMLGFCFLLLLALIFRNNLIPVFILTGLYLIDLVFSFFLRMFLRPMYRVLPLGIEMVTFNTVVAALAFGPTVGVICGVLFGLTYYAVVFNFNSLYQIINIPAYGLVGYLAATLPISNIVGLGITVSAIYSLITCFLIFFFMGGKISKCFVFIISNVLFNYWLFTRISPIVLSIVQ